MKVALAKNSGILIAIQTVIQIAKITNVTKKMVDVYTDVKQVGIQKKAPLLVTNNVQINVLNQLVMIKEYVRLAVKKDTGQRHVLKDVLDIVLFNVTRTMVFVQNVT